MNNVLMKSSNNEQHATEQTVLMNSVLMNTYY